MHEMPAGQSVSSSHGAGAADDVPGGVVTADSIDAALDAARGALADSPPESDPDVVYVAGGGSVYEQFLPVADRIVLTEVHESVEGDTRFPDVDWDEWTEVEREDGEDLSFVVYVRRPDGD